MSEIKVSDLHGPRLAYWVAQAAGIEESRKVRLFADSYCLFKETPWGGYEPFHFRPDNSFIDGGPIIERELIRLAPHVQAIPGEEELKPYWIAMHPHGHVEHRGSTVLEAAMRAYVASKYGDAVPHNGSVPYGQAPGTEID